MRYLFIIAVIWLTSATSLAACEIKWPDPDIQVPPLVQSYIASECHAYKGFSEENVDDCILGERYGYRAVVEMLADAERGVEFAERYRGCAVGLGDLGGRFHRRKAECMATVYLYVWRFEFTRQASVAPPDMNREPLIRRSGQTEFAQYRSHAQKLRGGPPEAATVVAQN